MNATVQTSFKNEHKASYLARDIAQSLNRGSAIRDKIETVLNQIREVTETQSLKTLSQENIQTYIANLAERVENSELTTKTTATYVSVLNDIIKYTNEHLNRNLETVSAKKVSLSPAAREYNNRAVDIETHQAFINFLEQKNDIRAQALIYSVKLERELGLRLRESLAIKQDSIKQALETNKLNIGRADQTKNAKERTIPIKNESQVQTLQSALHFMQEHNLKSLIPTKLLLEQYYFAQNIKQEFNRSTDNKMKMDFHGERYYYAQNRFNNDQITRSELSRELGHNREEITNVYLNK